MAKLYFKYGAMGSSKTANALMTRFNYLEKGKNIWLLKPSTDTRYSKTAIVSRIGLEAEATIIGESDSIENLMKTKNEKYDIFSLDCNPDAIIVDEAQFLTERQIEELRNISTFNNITVICFGLRTDFRGKLFPGSKKLMELADEITELNTICKCGKKAIINARIINGTIITEGKTIDIGGDEKYEAMCWECWYKKTHKKDV